MSDCPNGDVRDALPDYLHGRLDAARRREVESHLASCPTCRAELSLLRDLRDRVRHAPAVDAVAIASAIPPYRAPVRRAWSNGWRVAAALVAIAVGGTSIVVVRSRGREAPTELAASVRAATASPRDSQRIAATQRRSEMAAPARPTPVDVSRPAVETGELAMATGAIGELSDRELSALVEGLESLDGLPPTEVEALEPVSVGAQEGL